MSGLSLEAEGEVQMNVLWKCCLRSLRENRRRTIVTILGTALATALITAVSCMGTSYLASRLENEKKVCDWHGRFLAVEEDDLKYFENNKAIEEYWLVGREGYGLFEGDEKGIYLDVRSPEKKFFERQNIVLSSGRLPENEGEILLCKELRTKHGMDLKLGDMVTIQIGDRFLGDSEVMLGTEYQNGETIRIREVRTYEIVGFYKEGEGSFLWMRRGGSSKQVYNAYTADAGPWKLTDVYLRYTKEGLKNHEEVEQGLLGISPELRQIVFGYGNSRGATEEERLQAACRAKDYTFNMGLAYLECPSLMMNEFYATIGAVSILFLIIVYAGVFTINNSFDLSFTERIRSYGMLSSVGTTKRQKRMILWMEAAYIGAFGIPLGIVIGCLFTLGLVAVTNLAIPLIAKNLSFHMVFHVSVAGILASMVVAALMILLSAAESAVRASRITPISAIRMNDTVKSETKPKKASKLIGRLFGIGGVIALQNFRRSKKKYRAIISTIAVSVALFLGLGFIGTYFDSMEGILKSEGFDWQLEVTLPSGTGYEDDVEIANSPLVTKYIITTIGIVKVKESETPQNDDFVYVVALDDNAFSEICKLAGVSASEAKGKAIVNCTRTILEKDEKGNLKKRQELISEVKVGDTIAGRSFRLGESEEVQVNLSVAGLTEELPLSTPYRGIERIMAYVSWDYVRADPELFASQRVGACFLCEDTQALIEEIEEKNLVGCTYQDYDREYREIRFAKILTLSILAGFITVITLMGIANIVNAVNTNLELRAPEFAKLKAIGMTEKQFGSMLWTESMFYGAKGLLWGILCGIGISYGIYRFLWESSDKSFVFDYHFPVLESLLCVVMVAFLFYVVIRYGQKKMQRKNLIDTIREENL